MKRLLLLGALILSACASPTEIPPTDSGPDFVFITATPTLEVDASATTEPLPFRDLSSPTPSETAVPPTGTPAPATATTAVIVATVIIPAAQPTKANAQVLAQPTQAVVVQPPAPTDPPPTAIPAAPVSDVSSAEQAVIDLSNLYRTQNGLAALARDEGIMSIARARSADMVARGYFGHYDPITGASLAKPQILALGFGRAGENYYVSGRSLEEMVSQAVTWFMGDPPHRANILNSAYNSIGVGIAWNGQMWILTQDFGGP